MGIHQAMKWILVLVALATISAAHQTEPETLALQVEPPPGEEEPLAMIQEGADATKYRLTWKTKANPCTGNADEKAACAAANEKFASNANFKITITGAGGSVEEEVFKHPGEVKDAASGVWSPTSNGLVQTAEVDPKKDLGQLTAVKITTTAGSATSWTPSFVKINTNNKYTGLGSGIYYAEVNRAIDKDNTYEAKVKPGDGEVSMTKCEAQFCERQMDQKLELA